MKQFNLSEWLKDKSRKVVTRDGRPVRIVCWDKLDDRPAAKEQKIVALIKEGCKENVFMYNNNGDGCISGLDLFFVDEEEELTGFEKELEMMMVSFSNGNLGSDVRKEMPKQKLHSYAHRLFDLARKELEATGWRDSMRKHKEAYEQGKQDVLKDFPKWKKSSEHKDFQEHLAILEDNKVLLTNYLEEGDYYIVLNDLKTLPKEE